MLSSVLAVLSTNNADAANICRGERVKRTATGIDIS